MIKTFKDLFFRFGCIFIGERASYFFNNGYYIDVCFRYKGSYDLVLYKKASIYHELSEDGVSDIMKQIQEFDSIGGSNE